MELCSCYAHQISLAALLNLLNEAFKTESERTICEEWKYPLQKIFSECEILAHYHFVGTIIIYVYRRVLSFAGFSLFVTFLKEITIWICLLDHAQYAWWMPVFVKDLLNLSSIYENIYQYFSKGYFPVNRSGNSSGCLLLE